ncbi:MAG: metallophosphoesterase family protein [Clostridiales bacterium]|nr:metallophosphoesterase family protein [Clostridiales bacterium]
MKILAVADVEDKILYDHFTKERVKGVELIVACGDLRTDYLDFLMTMVNVPMIYVRGNHDDSYFTDPPLGAVCIEDKIYKFNGVTFMGLGGSNRYRNDGKNMYTEKEMKLRALKLAPVAKLKGGVDVLVTHSPARGYGDMTDLPHRGFDTFNDVMNKYHPKVMLHGHVHMNYGIVKREYEHPSGTRIVNACGFQIIDI